MKNFSIRILTCALFWNTISIINAKAQQSGDMTISANAFYDRTGAYYVGFSGVHKSTLLYTNNFSGEVHVGMPLTDFWTIQTGLDYCLRGYARDNVRYKIGYLRVPLSLQLEVLDQEHLSMGLYWGAYLGRKISSSQKIESSNYAFSVNPWDWGVQTGAVLQLPIAEDLKVDLHARAQFGFSNVSREVYDSKLGNICFSLGVGITKQLWLRRIF